MTCELGVIGGYEEVSDTDRGMLVLVLPATTTNDMGLLSATTPLANPRGERPSIDTSQSAISPSLLSPPSWSSSHLHPNFPYCNTGANMLRQPIPSTHLSSDTSDHHSSMQSLPPADWNNIFSSAHPSLFPPFSPQSDPNTVDPHRHRLHTIKTQTNYHNGDHSHSSWSNTVSPFSSSPVHSRPSPSRVHPSIPGPSIDKTASPHDVLPSPTQPPHFNSRPHKILDGRHLLVSPVPPPSLISRFAVFHAESRGKNQERQPQQRYKSPSAHRAPQSSLNTCQLLRLRYLHAS